MQEDVSVKRVLVSRLAAHEDVAVRALAGNAQKAAPLMASDAELAVGTVEDAQGVRAAVDGIDTLVLITAANPDVADQASALLAAAKEAGVRKLVHISVFEAATDGPTDVTPSMAAPTPRFRPQAWRTPSCSLSSNGRRLAFTLTYPLLSAVQPTC